MLQPDTAHVVTSPPQPVYLFRYNHSPAPVVPELPRLSSTAPAAADSQHTSKRKHDALNVEKASETDAQDGRYNDGGRLLPDSDANLERESGASLPPRQRFNRKSLNYAVSMFLCHLINATGRSENRQDLMSRNVMQACLY